MNVLILGAGGKTGRLLIDKAIAAGHKVTGLVHEHKEDEIYPAAAEIVQGDARNPSRLDQVMTGQHAVIDAIGGSKPFLETDLESSTAKVVIDVMTRNGVKRLIVISVVGVEESKAQAGFFYEHLLLPVFLRGALPDKTNMEHEFKASGLDFTIVRPPALKDSDPTWQVHIVAAEETAHSITRGDLAQFIVDQLGSSQYVGQAITIANK